jgi:hypothetical protein
MCSPTKNNDRAPETETETSARGQNRFEEPVKPVQTGFTASFDDDIGGCHCQRMQRQHWRSDCVSIYVSDVLSCKIPKCLN